MIMASALPAPTKIRLSDEEHVPLKKHLQSRTTSVHIRLRSRIVELAAQEVPNCCPGVLITVEKTLGSKMKFARGSLKSPRKRSQAMRLTGAPEA